MTKVMRKEARHTQRRDRASGVPLEILEHIPPKPESASFLLVLSPKPLTLRGALPHYLRSEERRVGKRREIGICILKIFISSILI